MRTRNLIWKEKHPVRGELRRTARSAWAGIKADGPAVVLVVAVMGLMIFQTLLTMGSRPSSPVAAYPPTQYGISSIHPPLPDGLGPDMIVSGADQGHLAGGER